MHASFLLLGLIPSTLAFPLPFPNLFARACTTTTCISQTDSLLYTDTLPAFHTAKAARRPTHLIWTDDGCSNSPDKPRGYNFLPSCQRHDFGYRNYKAQGRFSESNRKRVDDKFKDDLYAECSQYSGLSSWKGVECRRIADLYYFAVREFGDGDAHVPKVPGF